MAADISMNMTRRERLALAGLRLPKLALQRLEESGIYCVPRLSVVLQHSTGRYVVRAHESGGAVAELGAYCGFASDEGLPLNWLQRIETIGVNGLHARAVATAVVRIHVVRVRHTYDLLVTRHELQPAINGKRPALTNSILFHGCQGTLELELCGKDEAFKGRACPVFYDRGGDLLTIPPSFETAVRNAVTGVNCCGCTHSHLLVPPDVQTEQSAMDAKADDRDSGMSELATAEEAK